MGDYVLNPDQWPITTLGAHVDLDTGPAFSSARFLSGARGIRLIRGDNIAQGELRWGDKQKLWPEVTPDVERYLMAADDVVIGMDGSKVGLNRARVSSRDLPALLVQRVARLRARPTLDQVFLYYLISSPAFRHYVNGVKTGTSIPHVSGPQLRSFPFCIPPIEVQRATGSLLGALDDKIDVNRRMVETLEEVARRLFKSWFVDLDPVRGGSALPQPIVTLFPKKLVPSILGPIPEAWPVQPFGELLDVIEAGSRPPGGVSAYSEGVPSVGAESIDGIGRFDFRKTKYVPAIYYEAMRKGHVSPYDVLLYKDGGRPGEYEPHVTMVGESFPFDRFAINEHVFRLRSSRLSQTYLYALLDSNPVREELRQRGTGVAIPGITSRALSEVPTLAPPTDVIAAFDGIVAPIFTAILVHARESRALAEMRDSLLPNLVSGEIHLTVA